MHFHNSKQNEKMGNVLILIWNLHQIISFITKGSDEIQ